MHNFRSLASLNSGIGREGITCAVGIQLTCGPIPLPRTIASEKATYVRSSHAIKHNDLRLNGHRSGPSGGRAAGNTSNVDISNLTIRKGTGKYKWFSDVAIEGTHEVAGRTDV